MLSDISEAYNNHIIWLESEGRQGNQLTLDGFDMSELTDRQIKNFVDCFFTECNFENLILSELDFYHSEMFSCNFTNAGIDKTSFDKCEINYNNFTNTTIDTVSFHNAEIYECDFSSAILKNVNFAGASVWKSDFRKSHIVSIDFTAVDISEILVDDSTRFEKVLNLDLAHSISLNIGFDKSPVILENNVSLEWIYAHTTT